MKNNIQFKLGKDKEFEFSKFFKNVIFSSKDIDIKEHWDFSVKYDVKMLKREKRDGKYSESIHWVELKNVNGDKGWLYGDADYFSFETLEYWIVVSKEKLQDFIADKCVNKIKTDEPTLYHLYQRKNRKDLITLVKTIDLMYIGEITYRKNVKQ